MSRPLPRCPICQGGLHITEMACRSCGAIVRAPLQPCRFCTLPAEHLGFLETFLKCEGNLSRVERALNLSYPTVRNRLQAALAALYRDGEPESSAAPSKMEQIHRRSILEAVAIGALTAEEAAAALRMLV